VPGLPVRDSLTPLFVGFSLAANLHILARTRTLTCRDVAALPALCRSAIQPAAEKGLILAFGWGEILQGLKPSLILRHFRHD
jgi:hypothetical protein